MAVTAGTHNEQIVAALDEALRKAINHHQPRKFPQDVGQWVISFSSRIDQQATSAFNNIIALQMRLNTQMAQKRSEDLQKEKEKKALAKEKKVLAKEQKAMLQKQKPAGKKKRPLSKKLLAALLETQKLEAESLKQIAETPKVEIETPKTNADNVV